MIPALSSLKFPSDEEFIPKFLQEPYVFDVRNTFHPKNCLLSTSDDSVFFKRNFGDSVSESFTLERISGVALATIQKHSDCWKIKVDQNRFISNVKSQKAKTLAEAVHLLIVGHNLATIKGIQYTRGIIGPKPLLNGLFSSVQHSMDFLKESLLKEQPGNFLLVEGQNRYKILTNAGGKIVEGEYFNSPDNFSGLPEDITPFFKKCYNSPALRPVGFDESQVKDLQLCQSILDLTFLRGLEHQDFRRALNGWPPNFLDGVKTIIFYHGPLATHYFKAYVELMIYLAKTNRLDICIHMENMFIGNSQDDLLKSNRECLPLLDRIREELQGESLDLVLDKVLGVMFYNTNAKHQHVEPLKEDATWQVYFNNPSLKPFPTFNIRLAHSHKILQVHEIVIARFSDLFKAYFNESSNEILEKDFMMPPFPDKIVEDFIKIAYGFSPDFAECDFLDLFRFATWVQSEPYSNLLNYLFNRAADRINSTFLKTLIDTNLWKILPSKSKFFMLVGYHWSEIIASVPESDRSNFRNEFFNTWSEFLKQEWPTYQKKE